MGEGNNKSETTKAHLYSRSRIHSLRTPRQNPRCGSRQHQSGREGIPHDMKVVRGFRSDLDKKRLRRSAGGGSLLPSRTAIRFPHLSQWKWFSDSIERCCITKCPVIEQENFLANDLLLPS